MAIAKIGELSVGDIAIIIIYLVTILIVGLAAAFRPNRSNAEGYFLAGGTVIWLQAGCSLFASNIGSEHFVGIAGTASASGYAVVLFEWLSVWVIITLGWIFLPVYMASAIYTLPEYLGKRFGGSRIRMLIAVISLMLYILVRISVDLYAGALFVKIALNWDLYFSILMLLGISAIYTAAGGLAAVVYTETVQAIFMVIGGSILSIYAFREIGGLDNLERLYMSTESYPNETLHGNNTCGIPRSDSLHIWRGFDSNLPWLGFIIGQIWCSLWYWAADQVIVQRVLAAKDLSHGKGATVLASVFKISPMFLMVLPGMVSRILYADEVACVDPEKCKEICESPIGCSNIAYPRLVVGILPHGFRGLVTAVMLSALMSSLASTFNSSSTIFTLDIWTKIRNLPVGQEINNLNNEARRRYNIEIMVVGRICVLILVLVSVCWIPMVQGSSGSQLFMYIQSINCAVAPPIAAIFLLGILWQRTNEKGAFAGLLCGFIMSVCRMLLIFTWHEPKCGQVDTRPWFITVIYIHYLWFAAVLFATTVLVTIAVSLLTDPIPPEYIYRLTYWTRFSRDERKDISLLYSQDMQDEKQPILGSQVKYHAQPEGDGKGATEISFTETENTDDYEVVQTPPEDKDPQELKQIAGAMLGQDHTDSAENLQSQKAGPISVKSFCWKFVFWFCGISELEKVGDKLPQSVEDERNREEKQMDKILEEPMSMFLLWTCLGFVACAYLFLYIYYA
ncbi:sodium/mannose cotransporter SLC5A10-like [Amphiura filiformis]|uniref:sodium/mannose cotransporter SLC5A10-like n=1 Tax=Amphiura filiformis TaxID=82378 RepID=UPI003B21F969